MGRLYIIGNGFDRHFGLKTNPDDFKEFLKNERIYNETDNPVFIFDYYGVSWGDFENEISYIDLDEIENQNIGYPDYMSDHESDRDGVIYNMEMYLNSLHSAIYSALEKMVYAANKQLIGITNNTGINFYKGDAILTFNYTSTIEKIFNPPDGVPVEHIHGFLEEKEPLILGYNESRSYYNEKKYSNPEDGDYYLDQQAYLIKDFYKNLKKKIQKERLTDFLNSISGINEIVVLGHSLSEVDRYYFECIDKRFPGLRWSVFVHGAGLDVMANSKQYAFADRIEYYQW